METTTFIDNAWSKSKLLFKALIIGALVILLLIPTFYVTNLIEEREQRQKAAIAEVSSKWSGKQNIAGPVLVLPYTERSNDTLKTETKHFAYFLPDQLTVTSKVTPQERSRGIYKVMLYNAKVDLSGNFNNVSLESLKIPPASVLWNEAHIKINLSDPKGLNEELKVKWNDSLLTLSQQSIEGPYTGEGLIAVLPNSDEEKVKNVHFSTQINVNGSEQILFTPTGKTTDVTITSSWQHPSFTGSILPQSWVSDTNGFTAKWKSFAHKRDFPQQWKDVAYTTEITGKEQGVSEYKMGNAAFGANLFIPVNGYQKTMRSVKYAVLCILLTFAAFFLMDVIHKKSVHPFQYGLIGLALILFYVLLLSFSEYIGFDFSYSIASLATIGLIGWFVKGVLVSGRLSIFLSVVLLFIYSYVFTILQLQDYALLIGSIGLFFTLAIIMYFSRKFQW